MPQRGYDLQPRVAASATLGSDKKRNYNPDWSGLRRFLKRECNADATALRLRTRLAFFTQGSRSGNPGLEVVAPLGHS